MKLHLPTKLLAAVLACFCTVVSQTIGADVVSVNFSDSSGQVSTHTSLADDSFKGVMAAGWVDISGGSADAVNGDYELTVYDTETYDSATKSYTDAGKATLHLNTSQKPWGTNYSNGTLEALIGGTYLDANANSQVWTIDMTTDMMLSNVTLYFAGDGGQYSPVKINNAYYSQNEEGSTQSHTSAAEAVNWGNRTGTKGLAWDVEKSTISVSGIWGGELTMQNVAKQGGRGSLAALQVRDATAGVLWTATGDSLGMDTGFALGEATSTIADMAAGARYIGLNGQTLALDNSVVIDGIQSTTGDSTVTGSDLTVGILFAKDGATLDFAGTLAANSDLTVGGYGQVTISKGQTLGDLTVNGDLYVAAGASIEVTGAFNRGNSATVTGGEGASIFFNIAANEAYTSGNLTVTANNDMSFEYLTTAEEGAKFRLANGSSFDVSSSGGTMAVLPGTGADSVAVTLNSLTLSGGTTEIRAEAGATVSGNLSEVLSMHDKSLTVGNGVDLTYSGVKLGTATLTVEEGGKLTAESLIASDDGEGRTSDININGGFLEITGGAAAGWKTGSIRLAHWEGTTNLTVNGGEFRALSADVGMSDNGNSNVVINGGIVNVKGIKDAGDYKGHVLNTSLTLNTGGTLNIGSSGIVDTNGNSTLTVSLNGGMLGALEAWSSSKAMTVGNVTINTTKYLPTEGAMGGSYSQSEGCLISLTGTMTATEDSTLSITGLGQVALGGSGSTFCNIDNQAILQLSGSLTLNGTHTNGTGAQTLIYGNSFTKDGAGTLHINARHSTQPSTNVTINGGVLEVSAEAGDSQAAFTKGSVIVNAGATLYLVRKDSMGWGNSAISSITLAGEENNLAVLRVDGRQTMKTNIVLNGNTLIMRGDTGTVGGDSGGLNPYGGSITVTGENNTISALMHLRSNLTMNISGSLTISGDFRRQSESGILTKTGSGALTITAAEGVTANTTIDKGFTVSEGSVVVDRTLTIENLTLASGVSFTNEGPLTLTGTTVLGSLITNNEGASINFGTGALLDVSNMTATQEGRTYTYSMVTEGSTGTVTLGLANITGVTMDGKTWTFNTDGTFSYTLTAQELFCSTDITWQEGTSMDDGATFASGDMVTFSDSLTATLGANISSSGVKVVDGATVSIVEGEGDSKLLTADSVTVESGGVLSLSGSAMLASDNLTIAEGGRLILTGQNLASGVTVQGAGTLELAFSGTQNMNSQVSGFTGDLELSSGTYKMDSNTALNAAGSVTITKEGLLYIFGHNAHLNRDITISNATGDYSLNLDGNNASIGNADGSSSITIVGDAGIKGQWEGTINSAIVGDGSTDLTLRSENSTTLTVNSDISGVNDIIIAQGDGTVKFTSQSTIGNSGSLVVNSATIVDGVSIGSGAGVRVNSTTLSLASHDQTAAFTLAGGTLSLSSSNLADGSSIVLEAGNSSITSSGAAEVHASISGTGNLSITGAADDSQLGLRSRSINHIGTLTLGGTLELGYWTQASGSRATTIGTNVTDVSIASGATVTLSNGSDISNSGKVDIAGKLTLVSATKLQNGGVVNVLGGGTLVAQTNIASTGGVVVNSGGTVNISAAQTGHFYLNGGALNLNNTSLETTGAVTLGTKAADGSITAGSGTLTASNSALYSDIGGKGDLTLRGGDSDAHVYSDISHEGKLTMDEGTVNLGNSYAGTITVTNTGDVDVTGTAAVTLYGDKQGDVNRGSVLDNGGDVNISAGSMTMKQNSSISNDKDVNVSGGSLTVEAGAEIANTGSINVTGTGELNVMDGAIVSSTVNAGQLTIGEGATYSNVSVTAGNIASLTDAEASLTNAVIELKGENVNYAINGVTLTDSTVTVSNGTLTLDDTALQSIKQLNVTAQAQVAAAAGSTLAVVSSGVTIAATDDNGLAEVKGPVDGTDYTLVTTGQLNGMTYNDDSRITLTLTGSVIEGMLAEGKSVALQFEGLAYEEAAATYALSPLGAYAGNVFSLAGSPNYQITDVDYESSTVYIGSVQSPDAPGQIPEPTTTTLSLLALAALAARRRRQQG